MSRNQLSFPGVNSHGLLVGFFLFPKEAAEQHLAQSLHLLSTAPEAAAPPGAPPRGLEGIFSLVRMESPFIPRGRTYSATG